MYCTYLRHLGGMIDSVATVALIHLVLKTPADGNGEPRRTPPFSSPKKFLSPVVLPASRQLWRCCLVPVIDLRQLKAVGLQ
jgi:hypothetical protein